MLKRDFRGEGMQEKVKGRTRGKAERICRSSTQIVNKAVWKRVTLGHSSVTPEECTGHSFPQNRSCSFGPSTPCTTIVCARTLFRRILCLFVVFFLEVLFSWRALRPPVESGQGCCQNSCLGSSWSHSEMALILSQWITDVYPPDGYLAAAGMIMGPPFRCSYLFIRTLGWPWQSFVFSVLLPIWLNLAPA